MATLSELIVRIGADASKFEKQIGRVENKIRRLGNNFQDVGSRLTTGLSVPLAGLGGLALKSAIDFESAFAGVRKTVDATDAELAELEKGIRDLAKKMPAAATQISQVAESAGQLGIATEYILDFTRVMVDLGVTTDLTADQAANALARIANIMQMPQRNFDRLASTLVALGNAGASTESEIVEMALRIAGAGKQVGLTEAQVLSFASALASVGINAEAGGSSISRTMIAIENAVQKGGEKLRLFAQVAGMTVSEFRQAWEKDAAGALVLFIEGLARLQKEGKNVFQVLEDLALDEILVRDTLLRAAGAGDLFRKQLEIGSKAWKENTALAEEASKRYETNASKLQILRNRLNDVAITLGNALIPALNDALTAAEPLLNGLTRLAEAFANLSPEAQRTIVTILGVVAIVGPILYGIGAIINTVSGLVGAFKLLVGPQGIGGLIARGKKLWDAFKMWRAGSLAFGAALRMGFGPVGLAITVITALIAVGVLLWKNWDKIVNFLRTTWSNFVSWFTGMWGRFGDYILAASGPVGIAILIWKHWDKVKATFDSVVKAVKGFIRDVRSVFIGFWDILFGSYRDSEMALEVWSQIFGGVLRPLGDFLWNVRQEFEEFVWFIKSIPGRVAAILPQLPEIIAFWIGAAIGFAIDIIRKLPIWAHKAMVWLVDTIANGLKKAWRWAVELVTALYHDVTTWFSQLPERISAFASRVAERVTTWFQRTKDAAVARVTALWTAVTTWFSSLPGKIEAFLRSIPDRIRNLFNRAKDRAITAANNLYTGVRDQVNQLPDLFSRIFDRVWSIISSWPDRLWRKAKSIASSFWEGIKFGLGINSPSYVERAFMAMSAQAEQTLADLRKTVGPVRSLMSRAVEPLAANDALLQAYLPKPTRYAPTPSLTAKRSLSGAASSGRREQVRVEIPLYLNGREITRAVLPDLDEALARRQLMEQRARGVMAW